jgi:cardiolipin synthase
MNLDFLKANHVTAFRIASVPIIGLLVCFKSWIPALLALLLYILAAASDWLDGYLARKYHDTSLLGQVFDIVADKLLVIVCLLALGFSDRLDGGLIIPALAIVLREIFVMGLREYAARKADQSGEPAPDTAALTSTQLAKTKTLVEMVAIGILIAVPFVLPKFVGFFGSFLLWIAAVLSVQTGYQYFQTARFMPSKTDF